jgi:hypothetical protein
MVGLNDFTIPPSPTLPPKWGRETIPVGFTELNFKSDILKDEYCFSPLGGIVDQRQLNGKGGI